MNVATSPAQPVRPPIWRMADAVWLVFLIWTAVGFFVLPMGLTPEKAQAWASPSGLGGIAAAVLGSSDAIWMALAAIVVYLHAVVSEGLRTARTQALIILVSSTFIEWIGTRTGFPFGRYLYTANFGPRIFAVVPAAIPLAWYVVVISSRRLVLTIWPAVSRLSLSAGVALLAVLTDFNLEFVAWRIRGWWIWLPHSDAPIVVSAGPPGQNYAAWFALALGMAVALPTDYSLRTARPRGTRPILVLVLLNLLLAATRIAFAWRATGQ